MHDFYYFIFCLMKKLNYHFNSYYKNVPIVLYIGTYYLHNTISTYSVLWKNESIVIIEEHFENYHYIYTVYYIINLFC